MKRFVTAYIITLAFSASAVFGPILCHWLRVEYYGDPNCPLWHEVMFALLGIGYLAVVIAAWARAFNKTDKWF